MKKRMKKRMKKSKRYFFLLLVLTLLYNYSYSQIVDDFYSFSKKKNLIKMKIYNLKDNKDSSIKQQIIYLGFINTSNKESFKVFTAFLNLGGKGNSKLVFVSSKGKVFKYYMDLPSDLPFKIYNNRLYFKNHQTKIVKSMKVNVLEDVFCTPFECF